MKIREVRFILLRHALERRYGDAQGLKTHRTGLAGAGSIRMAG